MMRPATSYFGQVRGTCLVIFMRMINFQVDFNLFDMTLCLPLCRYGIKNVQVLAKSARMVVQDCAEAEENIDARDKFFM